MRNTLMRKAELKDIYFNIYMTYTNSTAHKKMKDTFKDQGSKVVNEAMRNWLESEGVRLIKTK